MLKFQWNALRKGDKVLVHGPGRRELSIMPGVVTVVETHGRTNGVGIRVTKSDATRQIIWPSYLAVHLGPPEPGDPCWRCRAVAT